MLCITNEFCLFIPGTRYCNYLLTFILVIEETCEFWVNCKRAKTNFLMQTILYLSDENIRTIDLKWSKIIDEIDYATVLLKTGLYSKPLKPYLRFPNSPQSRIIAMPASLEGKTPTAGIKWIASFPTNNQKGIKRAHAITILNDSETGAPLSILSSSYLSAIRTAAVSGMILKKCFDKFQKYNLRIGIIGLGPIGEVHLKMIDELFENRIKQVVLFDINNSVKIDLPEKLKARASFVTSWQEAFLNSDIVLTCTTSNTGYIDMTAKKGSIYLNISLRDYTLDSIRTMSIIIVDDWQEVSRENTDIHRMKEQINLKEEETINFKDFDLYMENNASIDDSIIVNPMGLAIYDIAVANYYYQYALNNHIGYELPI